MGAGAVLSIGLVVLPGQILPWLTAALPPQWTVSLAGVPYVLDTSSMVLAGLTMLLLALAYYLTHRPGLVLGTALLTELFTQGWLTPLLISAGTLELVLALNGWRTRNVLVVAAAGLAQRAPRRLLVPITSSNGGGSGQRHAGWRAAGRAVRHSLGPATGIGHASAHQHPATTANPAGKRAGVMKYLLVVLVCGLASLFLPWLAQQFSSRRCNNCCKAGNCPNSGGSPLGRPCWPC